MNETLILIKKNSLYEGEEKINFQKGRRKL